MSMLTSVSGGYPKCSFTWSSHTSLSNGRSQNQKPISEACAISSRRSRCSGSMAGKAAAALRRFNPGRAVRTAGFDVLPVSGSAAILPKRLLITGINCCDNSDFATTASALTSVACCCTIPGSFWLTRITRVAGSACLMARVACRPSMRGIVMSIRMTSGRSVAAFSTASIPSPASPQMETLVSDESSSRIPRLTGTWSSTMRTRMGGWRSTDGSALASSRATEAFESAGFEVGGLGDISAIAGSCGLSWAV